MPVTQDTKPETKVKCPDGRIGVLNQYPAKVYAWVRFKSQREGVLYELKAYRNDELEII